MTIASLRIHIHLCSSIMTVEGDSDTTLCIPTGSVFGGARGWRRSGEACCHRTAPRPIRAGGRQSRPVSGVSPAAQRPRLRAWPLGLPCRLWPLRAPDRAASPAVPRLPATHPDGRHYVAGLKGRWRVPASQHRCVTLLIASDARIWKAFDE